MKIQVNQKNLLNGLNIVCKAVSVKTTMTILQCVRMEIVDENSLLLSANDMELAIETKIPCTVLESDDVPICLEAGIFSNIVKKLPAGMIEISKKDSVVSIVQEKLSFELQSIDGDDFPKTPDVTGSVMEMSNIDFKKCVRKTIFATSKSENNPTLRGVEIKFSDDKAQFFATDGFRIAIQTVKLEKSYQDISGIVPDKTMQDLAKILPDKDNLLITFTNNHCMFLFDDTKVVSRIINGKMPNVERILQLQPKTELQLDKVIIQESIERAKLFLTSENDPIVLNIQPNILNLSLQSKVGKFADVIFSNTIGDSLQIKFSPELLCDVIKAIDDDEITMKFSGAFTPCFIQGESYDYVVLPVK